MNKRSSNFSSVFIYMGMFSIICLDYCLVLILLKNNNNNNNNNN